MSVPSKFYQVKFLRTSSVLIDPKSEFLYALRRDEKYTLMPIIQRYLKRVGGDKEEVCSVFFEAYNRFISFFSDVLGVLKSSSFETEIHIFDEDVLEQQLLEKAKNEKYLLSLDPLLDASKDERILSLSASRHYAPLGNVRMGIYERPGTDNLEEQYQMLFEKFQGESIALIDDNMYTGGTVKDLIQKLKKHHIQVHRVYVGMQFNHKVRFSCPLESVVDYSKIKIPMDLADPRDYLIGSGGLVVEHEEGIGRLPFLYPFISPTQRLSIPAEMENLFSQQMWHFNLLFFNEIETNLKEPLRLQDMDPFAVQGLKNALDSSLDNMTMASIIEKIQVDFQNILEKQKVYESKVLEKNN